MWFHPVKMWKQYTTQSLYHLYIYACMRWLLFYLFWLLVQSRKKDFQSDLSTSMVVNRSHNSPKKNLYSVIVFHLTLNCDQEIKRFSVCVSDFSFFFCSLWNILRLFFFLATNFEYISSTNKQSAKHLYSVIACSHHANAFECVLI